MYRVLSLVAFVAASLPAQLTGTYTINPALPSGPTNFTSLAAATTALAGGVSGPVVFELYDDGGPFRETVPAGWTPVGNGMACMTLAAWPGVSSTSPVTFRAAPGEQPVLDANGNAFVVSWNGADDTTLEGLEITGAAFDAINMYTDSSNNALRNTITRCHIHHCGGVGILFYGNSGLVQDTLITNNLLHDLQSSGGGSFSGFVRDGYLAGRRDDNTRILHNTIIVNTLTSTGWASWAIGEYHDGGASRRGITEIRGNIIVKTVSAGYVFAWRGYGMPPVNPILPLIADGNCIWDTSSGMNGVLWTDWTVTVGGTTTSMNSTILCPTLNDWRNATSLELASIEADPSLSGPGLIPYHLSPGSPCIGAAAPLPEITVDIDGDARDATPDIGCDEVVGGPQPSVTPVGAGCPGSTGLVPALSTTQLPFIGNAGFSVDVTGALPGVPAFLFASVGLAAVPANLGGNCPLYLEPVTFAALINLGITPFVLGTDGSGQATFPLPVPPTFTPGTTLGFQAAATDPILPLGFTVTNALVVVVN